MHRTIFSTPIVNTLLRAFSVSFLKITGWKIEGSLPAAASKSVLIAAPHTSNWDLPYTLMVAFALRLNIYWMGKAQIFRTTISRSDEVARRHPRGARDGQQSGRCCRRQRSPPPMARCN
jgi:hypothetical protein